MTTNSTQKIAAKQFAQDWSGKGYEKGETSRFWIALFIGRDCKKTASGGVFVADAARERADFRENVAAIAGGGASGAVFLQSRPVWHRPPGPHPQHQARGQQ